MASSISRCAVGSLLAALVLCLAFSALAVDDAPNATPRASARFWQSIPYPLEPVVGIDNALHGPPAINSAFASQAAYEVVRNHLYKDGILIPTPG